MNPVSLETASRTIRVHGADPWGNAITVDVAGSRIAGVEDHGPTDGDLPLLWPGLVDLQVNGYRDHDINSEDLDRGTVAALVAAQHAAGTTSFCPTLVTASEPALLHALDVLRGAREADPAVAAAIPCIHVEGPYLSALDGARGAHDPALMRDPSVDELARWQAASGGAVGIVTLAPERPGAVAFIRAATRDGVLIALGHCVASPDQVRAAVQAGARLSTHLGNGTPLVQPRHPNHIWAQLAEDRLVASFIADGHHLPVDTLTVMLRAKGFGAAVLVSDSTALAGMPPGRYATPVGGDVEVEPDGRLRLAGGTALAGSGSCLRECVWWLATRTEVSLSIAVELASTRPADLLGRADLGRLTTGARADLVLLEPRAAGAPEVSATMVAGRWVGGGPSR